MMPRETPCVSVCIPCHNGEHTVREAVDSALLQDADVPVEIIVIDDCSTDGTPDALAAYAGDPRVKIVRNTENLGAAGSRNKAVRLAAGKYVAFLDSDDRWAPGKLKKQVKLLEATGHCLCCTGRELLRPDGTATGRIIGVREQITYRDLLRMNSINCSSVLLLRRTALDFPMEHEDSHEDYITWLSILRSQGPADGIDEPLLLYRLSSSGKSGSKLQSARMTYRVYRYAGLGPVRSILCFISYAFHGVFKYLMAGMRGRKTRRSQASESGDA